MRIFGGFLWNFLLVMYVSSELLKLLLDIVLLRMLVLLNFFRKLVKL